VTSPHAVPLRFVFKLANELTTSDITDGFCQRVVLDYVLDSQTLHANHLVFIHNGSQELVLVVSSQIENALGKRYRVLHIRSDKDA
jgi:hypothetical protein